MIWGGSTTPLLKGQAGQTLHTGKQGGCKMHENLAELRAICSGAYGRLSTLLSEPTVHLNVDFHYSAAEGVGQSRAN